MKKKMSMLMAAAITAGMLSGVTVNSQEWEGDVDHIVVTYLTLGTTPADLMMVQDALNEQDHKGIGVEVELKPVSVYVRCHSSQHGLVPENALT